MRKLYALLLALALVFCVTGTALAAETNAPLSGTVTRTEKTLALTLTAEEWNVSGTLTLQYDPQVLTFQEVKTVGTLGSLKVTDGAVTLGYAMETSQAAQTGDVVVTAFFQVLGEDTTMVDIRVENWNEESGMDLYVSVPTAEGQTRFLDVPETAWFYEATEYVAQRGIMKGVGDRLFMPNAKLTRAMFVTTLGRMAGVQEGEYPSAGFADVEEGAYYAAYVDWAAAVGVTTGISDTEFGPNGTVTREQAATFLYRFAELMGMDMTADDGNSFGDYATVSHWAKTAVNWASSNGLVEGWDGNFYPTTATTRAQCAALLQRLDRIMD